MDPQNKPCYGAIQYPTTARDATTNETHMTWSTLRSCWVGITPNYSKERREGGQMESAVSHTLRGHYEEWKDVKGEMRFVFDGRVFAIVGVKLDYQHRQDAMITANETDETP